MANTLKLEIIVDDKGTPVMQQFASGASTSLGKVQTSGESLNTSFAKTWAGITVGVSAAIYAFQKIVGVASEYVQAYMESESAVMKLGIALNNQGAYTREALADMVAFSEEMQRTTTVEDDLAKSIMGTLASFGMTTEEIKRSTQAAADMASFTGKSIETVADLLGKAYAGNTSALSRYGIVVDESVPKAEKFQAVLEQLEQRFGGAAQAELSTYAGQWKQLQNQWGDIKEVIGLGLLKTIEALLTGIGLIGVTFLSAGEAVLNTIDTMTTPFQWLLKGFAALAEMAGMDRAADALRNVAGATEEARKNITSAKEATLAWTSKQYDLLTASGGVTTALDKMADSGRKAGGQDILSGMTLLGNEVVTVAEAVKKEEEANKAAAAAAKKLADENAKRVSKALEDEAKLLAKMAETNDSILSDTEKTYRDINATQKSAYDKEIDRIIKMAGEWEDKGADAVNIAEWVKAQVLKAEKEQTDETINGWIKAGKAAEDALKDEIDAVWDKNEKKRKSDEEASKNTIDLADKQLNAAKSMYNGMGNYSEEYYAAVKALLEKEADARLKILLQGVTNTEEADALRKASAEKLTSDLEDEEIKRLKKSEDWKDGVVAYFKEADRELKTAAENMTDYLKTFAESSKTAISTTLFDAIKDGTVDVQKVWTTFSDTMLKKFTDNVGQMASDFLMKGMRKIIDAASEPISMVFSAAWDAASAIVLAGIKALKAFFAYSGGYVREGSIGAYAGGGQVQGYASGGDAKSNDTVLAWLSPGEYVMPRSAVNPQTIPHLEYMREHKEPRGYAYGGIIPHDDQLPGLSAPYQGSLKWYDDDEWEKLTDPYRMLHDYYGLTYYNGKWGKLGFTFADEGPYPSSFSEVSDPITYTGRIINEQNGYQLQDENDPPQALDTKDYEYLLNWYGSSIGAGPNTGWGDGVYDQWAAEHGYNPLTGSVNPNVIWSEEENGGYRFYMRDGSDYWADPSESNFLKRWMPALIKTVSMIAAIVMSYGAGAAIAAGASVGTAGSILGAGSGIAAGFGSTAAAVGAAVGAGTYSAFASYGESGSVTGALIAGIISAAATYAGASMFSQSSGSFIAQTIRKGAGEVLQGVLSDWAGSGGRADLSGAGQSGGLGDLESSFNSLPSLLSKPVSLRSGIDYVPYDDFPARLHEGERVLTKEENRAASRGERREALPPVQVNLVIDNKVLASTLYKQSKAGIKIIHERGLAYA